MRVNKSASGLIVASCLLFAGTYEKSINRDFRIADITHELTRIGIAKKQSASKRILEGKKISIVTKLNYNRFDSLGKLTSTTFTLSTTSIFEPGKWRRRWQVREE